MSSSRDSLSSSGLEAATAASDEPEVPHAQPGLDVNVAAAALPEAAPGAAAEAAAEAAATKAPGEPDVPTAPPRKAAEVPGEPDVPPAEEPPSQKAAQKPVPRGT